MATGFKTAYDRLAKFGGASLVLLFFPRRSAIFAAGQFPDRVRPARSGLAGDALDIDGRRLVALSILGLSVAGFSPLGYWLLYSLEQRFPPWVPSRGEPDGIIVLGGSVDPDLSEAHDADGQNSADRIITAAALARRYPDARVVFTGGSASLIGNEAGRPIMQPRSSRASVSQTRLMMERGSRNTAQNAEFTKALATPKTGERWLLVTSAFHMPRAIGLFRKAGFAVEACPVDWRIGDRDDLFAFRCCRRGIRAHRYGVREWIGLLSYWLTGRIDESLAGPRSD